jgi:dihydrolipoamide dehydrogenase
MMKVSCGSSHGQRSPRAGAQAVGAGVSELTSSLALAIEMGAVLEDIAGTIGAHPTRSEAIHEAALGALGCGLHF